MHSRLISITAVGSKLVVQGAILYFDWAALHSWNTTFYNLLLFPALHVFNVRQP